MPSREQCKRRSQSSEYIFVKAKSEAQSLRNACPSCCEHFPVDLPRKVLQDHFQEAHLTRRGNEASLRSSAVLSPASSDSSDSASPFEELLDEQTHAKHEFLNALDRLVITLKNLILKK